MTEKTTILGIRLRNEDKERLRKYITRASLESILRQVERGEVRITDAGVEVSGADCDTCPYVENDLNMDKFDEVCGIKGIERQKALDMCVQMMWR